MLGVVYPEPRGRLRQISFALMCAGTIALSFVPKAERQSTYLEPSSVATSKRNCETVDDKPIAQEEESCYERDRRLSQRVYWQNDVLVLPHPVERGIDAVSIYRGKNLLFRKSLNIDYTDGSSMCLCFPYTNKPANSVRSFDGGVDDFISNTTESGTTPFTDFNGDGIPELIVAHNNGNASEIYEIYSAKKSKKTLATIEAVRSSAEFMDIDQDGRCEVLVRDPTYFGWLTCNAQSPMPLVILKMKKDKLKLATALMKTQPPSRARQEELLSDWADGCEDEYASLSQAGLAGPYDSKTFHLAPVVWSGMLNLIYSGNSKVAFRLLDEFWPKGIYAGNLEYKEHRSFVRSTKLYFKEIFLDQLSYSPYLREIKQLNQGDRRICDLQQESAE